MQEWPKSLLILRRNVLRWVSISNLDGLKLSRGLLRERCNWKEHCAQWCKTLLILWSGLTDSHLVGGGDNPMGTPKSQNQGPWPLKPDTYDRYKVFCLKDHILSIKKKRVPSHITFWIFRHFLPIGSHWEKRNLPFKMMPNELLSIDYAL